MRFLLARPMAPPLPLLPLPLPLLLLLLLLQLAAAALPQLPEQLALGRPVRVPVFGDRNVSSYHLNLSPETFNTSRLSVALAFDPPTAVPRLRYPRPVALLHNVTEIPSLSQMPGVLSKLSQPSFQVGNSRKADTDAYYSRRLRSGFLSPIRSQQAISVYNVALLHSRGPFPNGTLTLTLLDTEKQPACPGTFDSQPCSSNGACVPTSPNPIPRCVCKQGFGAPICSESLSRFEEGGSDDNFDANDLDVEPTSLEKQYVVVVQPFQIRYVTFNYSALSMKQGDSYELSVRILRGTTSTTEKRLMLCEIYGSQVQGNRLPNWNTDSKQFERSEDTPSLLQANFLFRVIRSRYVVALFANASHTDDDFNGSAAFAISTPRLVPRTSPVKPRFLPQAMLPVCLSLIFIAGLAVLLVFWLDRRSGRNKAVDRLSEAELLRMYPAYVAESDEGECPICLGDMQVGDSLRALRCEHHFHAECLDPWVCENRANCPTCRASVRVDHLSDNHREPVCSRNRSCWRFLFCTSRDDDDGDDGEGGQRVPEQEEVRPQALEGQQQSLEPQPEHLHYSGRIAFPDRAHWPLQVRTASNLSTSRTQSTTHAVSESGSEETSMHTALDLSFGSNRREQLFASAPADPP